MGSHRQVRSDVVPGDSGRGFVDAAALFRRPQGHLSGPVRWLRGHQQLQPGPGARREGQVQLRPGLQRVVRQAPQRFGQRVRATAGGRNRWHRRTVGPWLGVVHLQGGFLNSKDSKVRKAVTMLRQLTVFALGVWGLLSASLGGAFVHPSDEPALISALAARSPLLAIERAGNRVVAVGLRGHIVYSDDSGATWRQALVPVSVDLLGVSFPSPKVGWAVGHGGVVLATRDG